MTAEHDHTNPPEQPRPTGPGTERERINPQGERATPRPGGSVPGPGQQGIKTPRPVDDPAGGHDIGRNRDGVAQRVDAEGVPQAEEPTQDELVDEASDDSFPASDPPAYIARKPQDIPDKD